MTEQQIIELEKELSSASFILETLGEEPGFNGSILLIDDLSAKKIAEIINKTIEYLSSQASDKVDEKYNELIMAVCKKYSNESRHQTALRYILEREQSSREFGAFYEIYSDGYARDTAIKEGK